MSVCVFGPVRRIVNMKYRTIVLYVAISKLIRHFEALKIVVCSPTKAEN
jgi:hypothetical protein